MNRKQKDQKTIARWKRSQLAAIAGLPPTISDHLAAALLGESKAEIFTRIERGELETTNTQPSGSFELTTAQFVIREDPISNPPQMLRRTRLRPRPDAVAGLLRRNGDLRPEDVRELTGQTVEEVIADVQAGRLRGRRLASRIWSIAADQFLPTESAVVTPGPFARWTTSELSAIIGVPFSITFETAAALLGESVRDFKSKVKERRIWITRLNTGGGLQVDTGAFLRDESYGTIDLHEPEMLRDGKLVMRWYYTEADVLALADPERLISVDNLRKLTGQTREEIAADAGAGRLIYRYSGDMKFPARQFLRSYRKRGY